MTDREFLIWLHFRLVEKHKESKYVDYMHFLRDIIHATPKDRRSRGEFVTMHSMTVLDELYPATPPAASGVAQESQK